MSASLGEVEAPVAGASRTLLAEEVRVGLCARQKRLPPHLLYDARGSRLYEQITEQPEYYPFWAERSIFVRHARELASLGLARSRGVPRVLELGAGSARKTSLLLRAILERGAGCVYMPLDVSASALQAAREALLSELPELLVEPSCGQYMDRLPHLPAEARPQLALFIGSSIGNLEDAEAVALLSALRAALASDGRLLLGTDLRKDRKIMLRAYDDARGVTAAFNANLLVRINRELGGHFEPQRFVHRARWNAAQSRVEMHLESRVEQRVAIDALATSFEFRRGETIHTESSTKYDLARVDALLEPAGLVREQVFYDEARRFALHLCALR